MKIIPKNNKKTMLMFIAFALVILCACENHDDREKGTQLLLRHTFEEVVKDTEKDKESFEINNVDEHSNEVNEQLYGINIGYKKKLNITQFIQENGYYCGPACIQMVLHYFSIIKTQDEIAEELHTSPTTGSEYKDMSDVLNAYVFHKDASSNNEAGYHIQTLAIGQNDTTSFDAFNARMKSNIDEGYPAVLAVDLHELYASLSRANHFVVCSGYIMDETNENIAFYYIVDPYNKVQDETYGGWKVFTPKELFQAISTNVEPAYIW